MNPAGSGANIQLYPEAIGRCLRSLHPPLQPPAHPQRQAYPIGIIFAGLANVTVNLKWTDRAEDESGYRIYRGDELVTELPPNSTAFSEVIDVDAGENITYRIEVVNSAGASSSSPISFSCQ